VPISARAMVSSSPAGIAGGGNEAETETVTKSGLSYLLIVALGRDSNVVQIPATEDLVYTPAPERPGYHSAAMPSTRARWRRA
jgi:hypothetical protein